MARDEDSDDTLPPIGDGTVDHLEQAKKGKPLNFLLICKGSKIQYLLVKKKPIKKGDIGEAKQLGYKGEACIGVITGSGMQLVFNLAISDGYESEPCPDKKLKEFLADQADFKCQPTFAIVANPPEVPFDEADLAHPLVARFLGLTGLVNQVLDKRPESHSELQSTASAIRMLLQGGEFGAAEAPVDAFEARLKLLLGDGAPNESAAGGDDSLLQKLQKTLNTLIPQLKQAIANFPDKKIELLTAVDTIKKQLEAGDLGNAREGLLALGKLLKSLLSQEPTSQAGDGLDEAQKFRAEYEKKLALVEPLYLQAIQAQLGDTNKFRAVMAYATEQAAAGGFEKALLALDRLGQTLEKLVFETPASSAPRSHFALSKARVEWDQVRQNAIGEINRLKGILNEEYKDEPTEQVTLKAAFQTLDAKIAELNEELGNRLDDFLNATPDVAAQASIEAKKALQQLINFVKSDEVLSVIDGNEYAPEMLVAGPIQYKLEEIATALN